MTEVAHNRRSEAAGAHHPVQHEAHPVKKAEHAKAAVAPAPVKTPAHLVAKGREPHKNHAARLHAKFVAKGVSAEAKELEVARVLFAETLETLKPDPKTGVMNKRDLQLVAYSIRNRVAHPGFADGALKDVYEAVMQPTAFSSRGSVLYNKAKKPAKLDDGQKVAWAECRKMAHEILNKDYKPPEDPKVVYFHDKSISKPQNWDNKYWKAPKLAETDKFVYYGVAKVTAKTIPTHSAPNRG